MSEQLNRLAIWAKYLINASYDYREHCCEFSKFLVQNVPDDYWPDVAAQLICMLDDVDSMNKGKAACRRGQIRDSGFERMHLR